MFPPICYVSTLWRTWHNLPSSSHWSNLCEFHCPFNISKHLGTSAKFLRARSSFCSRTLVCTNWVAKSRSRCFSNSLCQWRQIDQKWDVTGTCCWIHFLLFRLFFKKWQVEPSIHGVLFLSIQESKRLATFLAGLHTKPSSNVAILNLYPGGLCSWLASSPCWKSMSHHCLANRVIIKTKDSVAYLGHKHHKNWKFWDFGGKLCKESSLWISVGLVVNRTKNIK